MKAAGPSRTTWDWTLETLGDRARILPPAEAHAETGQMLYVPVYSHVYWRCDRQHFNLACTLSVRNVDVRSSISLTAVDYHDTGGALVRRLVEQPRALAPLETVG